MHAHAHAHIHIHTYTRIHRAVNIIVLCIAPSDPVQNVLISNVTDGNDIAVSITWDPPTDPNGIIRYYRIQFLQVSDPLDNRARRKRNIPSDATIMNEFSYITNGSTGAPTNITLSGLG